MANPLDSLTSSWSFNFSITASKNVTGTNFAAVSAADNITKSYSFTVGVAAGQCNQYYRQVHVITASGTATIDLTNFTNSANQSASSFARVKAIRFRLLTAADDATNGTAASQVTIGNAGSNPFPMFLGAGTHTIVLKNGDSVQYADSSAGGIAVSGSAKNILITNNDAAVSAAVEVIVIGGET